MNNTADLTIQNAIETNENNDSKDRDIELVIDDLLEETSPPISVYSPVASFTVNVSSGDAPLSVEFRDHSINEPTIWNWSFGDGTWYNTTNASDRPIHTYLNAGRYDILLKVANAMGTSTKLSSSSIIVFPPYTTTCYPLDLNHTDIYTFMANAGDGFVLKWTSDNSISPIIRMYTPTNTLFAEVPERGWKQTAFETKGTLTDDGRYTLKITDCTEDAQGHYTFRIERFNHNLNIQVSSSDNPALQLPRDSKNDTLTDERDTGIPYRPLVDTIIEHKTATPVSYIKFNVTPEYEVRYKCWDNKYGSGKGMVCRNVTQIKPESYLAIQVWEKDTHVLIAEGGFGNQNPVDVNQTIAVRKAGDFIITVKRSHLDVDLGVVPKL